MDIVIRPNRKTIPRTLLGSLVISAIMISVFMEPQPKDGSISTWLGYWMLLPAIVLLLGFSVLQLFVYGNILLNPKAVVKLTDNSLCNHVGPVTGSCIAWKDVQEVRMFASNKARMLVVSSMDNERFLLDKPFYKKFFIRHFIKKWGGVIVIQDQYINYDLEKLMAEMEERILLSSRRGASVNLN